MGQIVKQSNTDVVIVSACRTPIGKIRGALSCKRPDDLLALVLKEATLRAKIPQGDISEVIAGCSNQAGEDNRNIARMAVLLAGLPYEIPALTVNRLCASGLEAVVQATRSIQCGDNQVVVACGVESMSRAPWAFAKPELPFASGAPKVYDTALGWRFENQRLKERFPLETMGKTAENLADKYKIARSQQDEFALLSHQRAISSQKNRNFDKELVAVPIYKKGIEVGQVTKDEGPRADSSLLKLAALKPVFKKSGTVTAGNSSTLNDGAAAVLLTSKEYAKTHGLTILARIRSFAAVGVDPRVMGIGPVPATRKALKSVGMEVKDLDAIELNEAFAAQALAVIEELKLDTNRVNQNGGAIALGHPLGCTGVRILNTLLNVLEQTKKTVGLATLCVGVGQGLSMIIEKE